MGLCSLAQERPSKSPAAIHGPAKAAWQAPGRDDRFYTPLSPRMPAALFALLQRRHGDFSLAAQRESGSPSAGGRNVRALIGHYAEIFSSTRVRLGVASTRD